MKTFALFLFCMPLFGIVVDSGSATDQYFIGGATYTTDPAPDNTLRFSSLPFSYRIPVPTEEPHIVKLTFMEPSSLPPARAFSVTINEQLTFPRIAMKGPLVPFSKSAVVIPSDGFIEIRFTTIIRSAVISSISISPLSPGQTGSIDTSAISDNGFQSFSEACAAAANKTLLLVFRKWPTVPTQTCNTNLTFQGGRLQPTGTVTINGSLEAGLYQIFDLSLGGTVTGFLAKESYPEWWGAGGKGQTNDTPAINAMIQNGLHSITKRLHLPGHIYRVDSEITCGSPTSNCASILFSGNGTWNNSSDAATTILWGGPPTTGPVIHLTSAQNSRFEHFNTDGGGLAGIGMLADGQNAGGGSNHQNMGDNLLFRNLASTPGIGLLISGNRGNTNADVCCSIWRSIRTGEGTVTGIRIEGDQSVEHIFYDPQLSFYTSRGMDLQSGTTKVYNAGFVSLASGPVDDVYITAAANETFFIDSYHEILSTSTPLLRHAFNMPGPGGGPIRKIEGARILSRVPVTAIEFQQAGTLVLNHSSFPYGQAGGTPLHVALGAHAIELFSNTWYGIAPRIDSGVPYVEINGDLPGTAGRIKATAGIIQ